MFVPDMCAEGQEFAKILRSLINQNNQNSNWGKILGFRNMQEKLEKDIVR